MRISPARSGIVLPGIIAGLIYFVIAVATGASVVASVIGGLLVTVVALVIGFLFRAVCTRRRAARLK